MSESMGLAIIAADTHFEGRIKKARRLEIYGGLLGEVAAGHVVVGKGALMRGTLVAHTAEIAGQVTGDIYVKNLITIHETGAVDGRVQYGALQMAPGAELTAEVKNVPPTLSGDLSVTVHRGRSVTLTRADLNAIDRDDAPEDLTFEVSNVTHGYLALKSAPGQSVTTFTQADLNAGRVSFHHDGSPDNAAEFRALVRDDDGATSGTPQTVRIEVAPIPERPARM